MSEFERLMGQSGSINMKKALEIAWQELWGARAIMVIMCPKKEMESGTLPHPGYS